MNLRNNLKILVAILILISCNNKKNKVTKENKVSTILVNDIPKPDYETFKIKVKQHKTKLNNSSHKEVSDYLFNLLNNEIYYYWKGTSWDFNGTTQKPQEGNIACGYFVTNTLTDLGFKIQRIKLAQAASSEMIKKLCIDIHRFSEFEKLQTYLSKQPKNSIYIIGLDFHTGYILKDSSNSYFFHSNYINREGVIKEKIEKSKALQNNKAFMIGSLTSNKKILDKWISE